jgi:hypothetical protein
MASGAGKYDEACTAARLATGGRLVMLIVVGGKEGHGHEMQIAAQGPTPRLDAIALVDFLRTYLKHLDGALTEDIKRLGEAPADG